MEKTKLILHSVVIILITITLYLVFTGNNQIRESQKIIKSATENISRIQDSLGSARKKLALALKKIEFTENELKILKNKRDLLELNEKRKIAKNWDILQGIKKEIAIKQEQEKNLKEIAKKFER